MVKFVQALIIYRTLFYPTVTTNERNSALGLPCLDPRLFRIRTAPPSRRGPRHQPKGLQIGPRIHRISPCDFDDGPRASIRGSTPRRSESPSLAWERGCSGAAFPVGGRAARGRAVGRGRRATNCDAKAQAMGGAAPRRGRAAVFGRRWWANPDRSGSTAARAEGDRTQFRRQLLCLGGLVAGLEAAHRPQTPSLLS